MYILKIQVRQEIQYINLDHIVSAKPHEMGRWMFGFVNGEIVEVGGESAQAIVAYLDAMATPVGLEVNA